MIKLVTGDGISIEVPEGSILYKALSRFVGEVFVVKSEEKPAEEPKEVEKPKEKLPDYVETETVFVEAREYMDKLNSFYPDETSVVRHVLYNHMDKFFGLSSTKAGTYAAVSSTVNKDMVLLVRVIGGRNVYVSVPGRYVSTV